MSLIERYTFPTLAHAFMNMLRDSSTEKRCLDCGAGGERPPAALFKYHGYETCGIDIDEKRLKMAEDFCKQQGIDVDFRLGDMRDLDFANDSFGSVFSYNTICHLSREDTATAMEEMIRVLKPGGHLFVNFLSTDDFRHGLGEEVARNEFVHVALHTFFEDEEPEGFFEGTEITWKLKWTEQLLHAGKWMKRATLVYLAEKK